MWDPPPWPISGVITVMLFSAFNASHPSIGPPPTAALVYHFGPSRASPFCERCCLYCTFQTSVHILCTTVRGFPLPTSHWPCSRRDPEFFFFSNPVCFPVWSCVAGHASHIQKAVSTITSVSACLNTPNENKSRVPSKTRENSLSV